MPPAKYDCNSRISRLLAHLGTAPAAADEPVLIPARDVDTGTPGLLARIEEGGVGILTINRPDRANALGSDLTPFIRHMLHLWKDEDDVRVLIITGAGKYFSAGGNMQGSDDVTITPPPLPPAPDGWKPDPEDEHGNFKQMQRTLTGAIWQFPKPTIAAIPGAAAGLGVSIALSTDLRVAAKSGFVTMGYINVGLPGDYGGTWLATRLLGPGQAKLLAYTGDRVYGEEGVAMGLYNKVTEDSEDNVVLMEETLALARRIADKPPNAMRELKDNMNFAASGVDFLPALDREGVKLVTHLRTDVGKAEHQMMLRRTFKKPKAVAQR